ncbi:hypothetical protein [Actinoplanes sp. NPDC051494]|uniref:hypothetical protein n=1 Tax=Actinoplanes sp. NPDC051494 TaxID=3363907 RepID=UPI0037923118
MNRRFAVVLVPLLGLGLAACTDEPADPKTALVESTSGIKAGVYRLAVTMPGDTSAKGVMHFPSHSAQVTMVATEDGTAGTVDLLTIDKDRYTKLTTDMGELNEQLESLKALGTGDVESKKLTDGFQAMVDMFSGKTWMKLDMTRVTSKDLNLTVDNPDFVGVTGLLGTATAQRSGETITGTVDATTVKGDTELLGESAFEGLDPTQGKVIPYEATLDAEGRLAKLVLDVPKLTDTPAGKWTVEFSEYGAATQPQAPPAAEVQEAPDSAYEAFND